MHAEVPCQVTDRLDSKSDIADQIGPSDALCDGHSLLTRHPAALQVSRPPLGISDVGEQTATLLIAQVRITSLEGQLEQAAQATVTVAGRPKTVPSP